MAFDRFDPDRYKRRSAVETTFSILKRKWGGYLTARKRRYQRKEMKLKLIVYALERIGTIGLLWSIIPFLQSHFLLRINHDPFSHCRNGPEKRRQSGQWKGPARN